MRIVSAWTFIALALWVNGAVAQDNVPPAPVAPAPLEAAPLEPVSMGNAAVNVAKPAPTAEPGKQMTLMMMIEHGGVILWVIMVFGFVAFVLSIYYLLTMTPRREAPKALVKRAQGMLHAGDLRGAYQMSQERDEYLALVLRAGLKMSGHERFVIQEAMESEGERGATALWQKISYLNNIASLTPLLGLLGTVWGMMQAFGAIALQDAQVKTLTLAYSVSLAMITTAGGLLVAIPSLAVYFVLRGRVIKIISTVEAHASEFVELIAKESEG
jgi:biopolymer transport protein ExbB